MTDDSIKPDLAIKQRTILGHPVGLYVLFLTQMWERFSYFGMLALLMLYMVNYFKFATGEASSVLKWYTTLIYFTPLLGGYLADRFLGYKRAILIGAVLMAIGHFLMAFEAIGVFYSALIVLVVGCGLLTPPLTTQVGLLYPPNDPRRDSAYTIFYMGINLGAFASPLLCGWLAENTVGRYHSGFTLAGIGMLIALITYIVGSRWVVEVPQSTGAAADEAAKEPTSADRPPEEAIIGSDSPLLQIGSQASVFPWLNYWSPKLLLIGGLALAVVAPFLAPPKLDFGIGGLAMPWPGVDLVNWDNTLGLELAAITALLFAWITSKVEAAVRDRVLAILVLGIFAVLYWTGALQGPNALNLWADQNTNRHLTTTAPAPTLYPEATESTDAAEEPGPTSFWERWTKLFKPLPKASSSESESWGAWWTELWNPMSTAWFQSVNPLAILLLAPVFAALWTYLGRHGLDPSIPTKMALGVLCMALAFALMLGAAQAEDQPSSAALAGDKLTEPLAVNGLGQVCQADDKGMLTPFAAGRLLYDASGRKLQLRGVLTGLERDRMLRETAPADFVKKLEELKKKTVEAQQKQPGDFVAQVQLDSVPPGFALRYAGLSKKTVTFDPAGKTLSSTIVLEEKEELALKAAAGDPHLRASLDELITQSSAFKVSSWWLFWYFALATVGELCLSPVGLSMVSKLAPPRFATLLMGLWLLTFSFSAFLAGAIGEKWETTAPQPYFLYLLIGLAIAAAILFVLTRWLIGMMHGAK